MTSKREMKEVEDCIKMTGLVRDMTIDMKDDIRVILQLAQTNQLKHKFEILRVN